MDVLARAGAGTDLRRRLDDPRDARSKLVAVGITPAALVWIWAAVDIVVAVVLTWFWWRAQRAVTVVAFAE